MLGPGEHHQSKYLDIDSNAHFQYIIA